MKIKIWGARGSIPSPLKPEEIKEKIYQAVLGAARINARDPQIVRNYVDNLPPLMSGTAGGNTACVEIQTDQKIIIIDAGSGIRELGLALMDGPCGRGQGEIHLLFSHAHWDHIQGFPFFRPAFVPGNKLFIYSVHDIEAVLHDQQKFINFPVPIEYMRATRQFIKIVPNELFYIDQIKINTIKTVHPGEAYAFRFEDDYSTFVFASDAEYKNLDQVHLQPYIDFYRNADALIFDAQFTLGEALEKVDWGHSSAMIGADLARAANVRKLILFHHDPTYSDTTLADIQRNTIEYQIQTIARPVCEVIVAYEGLTLDLTPHGAVSLQMLPDKETAIITPTTIFDERGVDKLELQLARLQELESGASSVIDLTQVETLTTASLKALISLRRQHKNSTIVLANPSSHVRHIIELAGFLDFFAIYPSVEAAIDALQTRQSLNLPGQLIKGRYQIDQKLNVGRLGAILRATDLQLNHRPVIIKILSVSFSEKSVERFLRQAEQMINLQHVNVVDIYDCGWTANLAFIVEEFAPGPNLHEILNTTSEAMPPYEALDIGVQIARALDYAHSRGKVHGDLQPKNVILHFRADNKPLTKSITGPLRNPRTAVVKVKRFGMGWLEEGVNLLDRPLALLSAHYLAPEQILGHPIDARTDLYALGVILYQMFTGQHPFDGINEHDIMEAHLDAQPSSLRERNPQLSNALEHFILKLLAKNPNDRYANAQQAYKILNSLVLYRGNQLDAPTAVQTQRILVGRQPELETLLNAWQAAQNGHGQLVFVVGETGIGKTRLVSELAAHAQSGGVLTGYCEEWEGSRTYRPFIGMFQAYFETIPPEVIEQQSYHLLSEMARLVPDLHKLLPNLPKAAALEPKQEQLRLMTTVTQFISAATRIRPWLIILEDMHWIDESSLHMFSHLARHCSPLNLLIIGTYRDTDLAINHPLMDALRSLGRQPGYNTITLQRLNQVEVGQLLANILTSPEDVTSTAEATPADPIPTRLIERIYQHTEGNPVYVQEVVTGLLDKGIINREGDSWNFGNLTEIDLPQTVRDAVLYRLRNLNRDTQRLLSQAAILGRTFRLADLQAMSGLSEWQVLERLDVALERQLIHEVFGAPMLSFNHAEIQQVLYDEMGLLRQRALHLQAGKAIEQRYKLNPEGEAAAIEPLAYHYSKAGKFEKAIFYGIEVAGQTEAAYANQTALQWYQRVVSMFGQLEADKAKELAAFKLRAHESLGRLLIVLGLYQEALQNYLQAFGMVETEESSPTQKQHLADLQRKIARVYKKQGNFEAALLALQHALTYLDENVPTIELAKVYLLGAEIYYYQGNSQTAITWSQQGLDTALSIDTPKGQQAVAQAYYLLGSSYRNLGNLTKAAELCQQSLRVYENLNDLEGLSRAYINLANVYADQVNWEQATNALQKSLLMKQEIGDTFDQGRAMSHLGQIAFKRGDYERAAELYQQSLTMWQQVGSAFFEAAILSNLAQLCLAQENLTEAENYLKQSQIVLEKVNSEKLTPEIERCWAMFYLKTNAFDEALVHIEKSINQSKEQEILLEQAMSQRILGEIQQAQGYYPQAATTLRSSLDILMQLSNEYEIAKTKHALALLDFSFPLKPEIATIYLTEAIETFERLGAKADLAHSLAVKNKLKG